MLHLRQCHVLAAGERTRAGFSSVLSKSVWLIISARYLKKNNLRLQKVSQSASLSKSSAGLRGLCLHADPQQARFVFRAGTCLLLCPLASSMEASLCPSACFC